MSGAREVSALRERRSDLESRAVSLFGVAAISMAVVCGAVIASGWFAGVIQDRYERIFWAGAVLAALAVVVFAAAAFPGGGDDALVIRRVTRCLRIGLALFVLAPALCITALVLDFFA